MSLRPRLELLIVSLAGLALSCAITYPVVAKLDHVGRVDTADGRLSIWNVAWVARQLVVDPAHLFDANIFYPNRSTLAYSENNVGAGLLALPGYWLSGGNPYVATNVAILLGFSLSVVGMYYLVRHLTADRRAAAVAAIPFAFCPHVFAHTAHIQLMMTAGLPFSMLALHRLVDCPTLGRGAQLGLVMFAQAAACGYYGIFAILIVGFSIVVTVAARRRWVPRFWLALVVGAVVAIALIAPLFWPYVALQRTTGFGRVLDDARSYSADWRSYLVSSSYAHRPLLAWLKQWNEVLFPGVVATVLGLAGAWLLFRRGRFERLAIYGGLVVLACWASFGPDAGLYSLLYNVIPVFGWLRAPSRFGLIVVFALSVLTGLGLAVVLPRTRAGTIAACLLAAAAFCESLLPFPAPEAPPLSNAYDTLRHMPPGPVIEMPFFYPEVGLFQHTIYMLNSTSHWRPLVNGYSDYIPQDFRDRVETLKFFPGRDAFKLLEPLHVRYAIWHMYGYNESNRRDIHTRLKQFENYLRPLYIDDETRLYEIVGFPP